MRLLYYNDFRTIILLNNIVHIMTYNTYKCVIGVIKDFTVQGHKAIDVLHVLISYTYHCDYSNYSEHEVPNTHTHAGSQKHR